MPQHKLSAGEFYEEYHGHKLAHLDLVLKGLREGGASQFVYLAGDSSLDNKHWFFRPHEAKRRQLERIAGVDFIGQACNGYEEILQPPHMVKDVAYWLNVEFSQRSSAGALRACAINTAIEESCLSDREADGGCLLAQDKFIRDNITENDTLIVDVGGNDVALRPSAGVVLNIASLLYLTPTAAINWSLAPGLVYFIHMFRRRLRFYIERMIEKRKPKKIIVCMLYFLDEQPGGSWADFVLEKLGYNTNPAKLQAVIRKVYEWGVCGIDIPGVEVVHVPLYEVLDGKDTTDYVQRVEPSVTGGQKMAKALAAKVFD